MKPLPGDTVEYRAFAGDRWQAVVLGVRELGAETFVDIDVVLIPGREGRLTLHAVRWCEGERPCAGWPEAT